MGEEENGMSNKAGTRWPQQYSSSIIPSGLSVAMLEKRLTVVKMWKTSNFSGPATGEEGVLSSAALSLQTLSENLRCMSKL